MADPEDKRLKNAWKTPGFGVTSAAGSAVSFGAAGVYGRGGQGSPLSIPTRAEPRVEKRGCRREDGD